MICVAVIHGIIHGIIHVIISSVAILNDLLSVTCANQKTVQVIITKLLLHASLILLVVAEFQLRFFIIHIRQTSNSLAGPTRVRVHRGQSIYFC